MTVALNILHAADAARCNTRCHIPERLILDSGVLYLLYPF
jgi:hypothetical protein